MVINASWRLGEGVVRGLVSPDESIVFTPPIGREDPCPSLAGLWAKDGEQEKTK